MIEITAKELEKKIFEVNATSFNSLALDIFYFQFTHNLLYQSFCRQLGRTPAEVDHIEYIPFLPISFFKTHEIKTTDFQPQQVFESSRTTGSISSRHLIKSTALYVHSFQKCFRQFYPQDYLVLGLLPSYLERENSSLVFMADDLIRHSKHSNSGFFLHNHQELAATLYHSEKEGTPTLLIGVTYALLDFFEQYPMLLQHTIVMETGGMKGRRKEITRPEVHRLLKAATGLPAIHAEYGMTELLSQAYAKSEGIFETPAWMKILIRSQDDPLEVHAAALHGAIYNGGMNVIDLANLYSCAFIATDDAGKLYTDGKFEILGRLDNSDMRGCSLMYL